MRPKGDEGINIPENLILVHHQCHIQYGQTREMFERCRKMALTVFSEQLITDAYNSMLQSELRSVLEL